MNIAEQVIKKIYVFLFARKALYKLNLLLYKLSLRGLGVLNYENDQVSGERAFIRFLLASGRLEKGVILDVGANVGHYSIMLRKNKVTLPVYAFEPHPVAFNHLQQAARQYDFTPVPHGAGHEVATAVIYDYANNGGSEHASMYQEVITGLRQQAADAVNIALTTVDDFAADNQIREIALLKIDTEGNELNVLKGAAGCIASGMIKVIQLEFNEMNVIARTFFKDIADLLPGYDLYRLLPDGPRALGAYNVTAFEIFAFQNIVAIRR